MRIPKRAGILVTDGRKMLLFRNEGDADYPNFQTDMKEQDDNPADRLQRSDAAGHTVFAGAAGKRQDVPKCTLGWRGGLR